MSIFVNTLFLFCDFSGGFRTMLGKIWFFMIFISLVCAIFTGRIPELSASVSEGAGAGINLILSIGGMIILWSSLLEVMSASGLLKKLSRLLMPILKKLFPSAKNSPAILESISANVSANLLGLGNAATPMALRALEKMQASNPDPDVATGDMITLTVLNTCSVAIVPSTILMLLTDAGAKNPFSVVVPIWICSFTCALLGLLLTRALRVHKK
jgi:spore maturation protein A